jgi:outer membrane protein assembly factor BamB
MNRTPVRTWLVLGCGVAALAGVMTVAAAEPSWRYFRCDGGVTDASAGRLPEKLDAPGALKWKVPLASGQSSPIVGNGRIFLTTYAAETKELATVAVDMVTGKEVWKRAVKAARIEVFHPQMGSPAAATPAWDGSRVFVFFGSYGLVCYDANGQILWEHPMGPFRDEFGSGSSPMLIDDKVVMCQDHDIESFLIALDRATGKPLWKVPRPDAVRSYSTPMVWQHGGRKELLVAGALELAGYDPDTGRRVWSTPGLARIVIPVPLPAGDTIYMASWSPGGDAGHRLLLDPWATALAKWDKNQDGKLRREEIDDREVLERFTRMDLDASGDLNQMEWERHAAVFQKAQNALLAIRPTATGELPGSDLLWKHQRGIPYVTSPLLDQGMLWMVKDGGIVTKLDAARGQLLQEERLPGLGGYYASPVAGDGKVYFASEQGVVSTVANQREWRVAASVDLHEKIHATPAIDQGRIYLRTEKALYCFGVAEERP